MCTALTLKTNDGMHLFGRNMDIEYSFNQSIIFVPRNFKYKNTLDKEEKSPKYALMGMASLIGDYPAFADGVNEMGLGCAGLNFPGYASYSKEIIEGMTNVPAYDFILWVLSSFSSVKEVKEALNNVNIVDVQINEHIPNATLHWIVTDKTGESIVVEKTEEKLSVFDNKLGVLTNSPSFDWHMTNLRQYVSMNYNQVIDFKVNEEVLSALGQGTGLVGLPGDFTPASRFIRTVLLKDAMIKNDFDSLDIMGFFHILNNVAMIKGSVRTPEEKSDITQYTSCMNLEEGVYYYNTYENNQINVIDMKKEYLDGENFKLFKYNITLNLNHEN